MKFLRKITWLENRLVHDVKASKNRPSPQTEATSPDAESPSGKEKVKDDTRVDLKTSETHTAQDLSNPERTEKNEKTKKPGENEENEKNEENEEAEKPKEAKSIITQETIDSLPSSKFKNMIVAAKELLDEPENQKLASNPAMAGILSIVFALARAMPGLSTVMPGDWFKYIRSSENQTEEEGFTDNDSENMNRILSHNLAAETLTKKEKKELKKIPTSEAASNYYVSSLLPIESPTRDGNSLATNLDRLGSYRATDSFSKLKSMNNIPENTVVFFTHKFAGVTASAIATGVGKTLMTIDPKTNLQTKVQLGGKDSPVSSYMFKGAFIPKSLDNIEKDFASGSLDGHEGVIQRMSSVSSSLDSAMKDFTSAPSEENLGIYEGTLASSREAMVAGVKAYFLLKPSLQGVQDNALGFFKKKIIEAYTAYNNTKDMAWGPMIGSLAKYKTAAIPLTVKDTAVEQEYRDRVVLTLTPRIIKLREKYSSDSYLKEEIEKV